MRFYTKTYESFDQNVLDFEPKRMGFWTKMYEIPKIGTKLREKSDYRGRRLQNRGSPAKSRNQTRRNIRLAFLLKYNSF